MEKKVTFEDINIGDELPPIIREVTLEKMKRYGSIEGDTTSFHVDPDAAAKTIYKRPIAVGVQFEPWFSEMMLNWLASPKGWLSGGKLTTKFIKPVYAGDTITTSGRVNEKITSERRVVCELTMGNQKGETVIVGQASALC